jgi:hypothetical protein
MCFLWRFFFNHAPSNAKNVLLRPQMSTNCERDFDKVNWISCWRPGMEPGLGHSFSMVGACTVSPTLILPSTWCLDLCSHISLKKTTCCVHIPTPDAKLDKVPELLGDFLMPD